MQSSASSLADFQSRFARALSDPETPVSSSLARALSVHRNTATKAAVDALSANYPVVQALFGAEPFEACAVGFVAFSPPRQPWLSDYGAGFDNYLRAYAPAMASPYIADVATLERLRTEALSAADGPALRGETLVGRIDLAARLPLHPAVRTASFASPAVSIWLAHAAGDEDALADLNWRAENVLITRPLGVVHIRSVDMPTLIFLTACAEHLSVGAAAWAAADAGGVLATLFETLIRAGAFASPIAEDLT